MFNIYSCNYLPFILDHILPPWCVRYALINAFGQKPAAGWSSTAQQNQSLILVYFYFIWSAHRVDFLKLIMNPQALNRRSLSYQSNGLLLRLHSFIHSFTHSLTHPPIHPFIHPFIYSSSHSFNRSFFVRSFSITPKQHIQYVHITNA